MTEELKLIIACVVASSVSMVFDFLLGIPPLCKKDIRIGKRLRLFWIGTFVFLFLTDMVLMLFGEQVTWRGVFMDVAIASVFTSCYLFFRWLKDISMKRKERSDA